MRHQPVDVQGSTHKVSPGGRTFQICWKQVIFSINLQTRKKHHAGKIYHFINTDLDYGFYFKFKIITASFIACKNHHLKKTNLYENKEKHFEFTISC